MGHVLAAFVDDIKVKDISHTIYLGVFIISKTNYDINTLKNRDNMTFLRLSTSGIFNTFISLIFCEILRILLGNLVIEKILQIYEFFCLTSIFSNSIIFYGFDGRDILLSILYIAEEIFDKDYIRFFKHWQAGSNFITLSLLSLYIIYCF